MTRPKGWVLGTVGHAVADCVVKDLLEKEIKRLTMEDVENTYMNTIGSISLEDVQHLIQKEAEHQGSWKKRGGVGAFLLAARKWDLIETRAKLAGYNVFSIPNTHTEDILETIGDLRRYLLLIEGEITARLRNEEDFTPQTRQTSTENPVYG